MARRKRIRLGEETKSFTLTMRAGIYDKLEKLVGPYGSKIDTIEQMTEYIFARKVKRAANRIEDSSCS